MRIDLHGFSVHDAWKFFHQWVQEAQQDNTVKSVVVVTGQGKIYNELPRWCENMSFVRDIQPHFGTGAYHISFYKKRRY